jgi:type I restriction-modification system DNA methylase subunit
MCKIAELDKNTRVLDPTCGSGSFIVQALIQELHDCTTDEEKNNVKSHNIYGIENEEKAYGLSTTNMLIHGDGNSNVMFFSPTGCFGLRDWIQQSNIDVVLMNPPYNAIPSNIPAFITDSNGRQIYQVHNVSRDWNNGKSDPTKGFCFVNYIADCVGKDKDGNIRTGKKLLCLLPLSCAIGSDRIIRQEKHRILENNTLEAVFSLPAEMFYPGASVNACCMFFTLGKPHFTTQEDEKGKKILKPREATFFGYYKDDGFIKRKGLGRVEKTDANNKPLWDDIEKTWINLYKGIEQNECLGVRKCVTADDEWLAEAYIKTDYSKLTADDFQRTLNDYFSYLVKEGNVLQKKDE